MTKVDWLLNNVIQMKAMKDFDYIFCNSKFEINSKASYVLFY